MILFPMPFPVKLNATLGQMKKKSKDVTGRGIGLNLPRMFWEFGDTKEGLLILACLMMASIVGTSYFYHIFLLYFRNG